MRTLGDRQPPVGRREGLLPADAVGMGRRTRCHSAIGVSGQMANESSAFAAETFIAEVAGESRLLLDHDHGKSRDLQDLHTREPLVTSHQPTPRVHSYWYGCRPR